MFNPQPVFTETYKLSTLNGGSMAGNAGGLLTTRISDLPQVAQYSTLYQKYRILKAKFICLANWNSESSDLNSSMYNQSIGIANAGMYRLAYAVNDSPAQVVPANENDVLTDNGCRVVAGKPKITISCRPAPNTMDANGVELTQRKKYINFATQGPDITHFGVSWWATFPFIGVANVPPTYEVYVKLTFQLSDPR
jgi:hypothetical protein